MQSEKACIQRYDSIVKKNIASITALLLCVCFSLQAQQIYISDAQKISTELIGYNILGKTKNNDVLIYKKFRFEDEIDMYDRQMTFKRRKEITIKNMDYETVEVYMSGDRIYHFYTYKDNKTSYLTVQKYNLELEKKVPGRERAERTRKQNRLAKVLDSRGPPQLARRSGSTARCSGRRTGSRSSW